MLRITPRQAVFSINSFAAAMVGLYVSFLLGLDRPFWAMATAYITSSPMSGAVRSKAVFRLAGTVVGAAASVVLVPSLADAPLLLSIAMALWIAGCQFVSLLDRTPRSYMFILAGYTAGIIGFPAVARPEAIFTTAVLRSEEIGIGVVSAAFIHSIVWPQSVTAAFGTRVRTILADASSWVIDALSLEAPPRAAAERRRLAADISELHAMSVHIPFDTARARPNRALLTALQDRLVMLLPLVSAVEDRLHSLAALGPVAPDMATLVADLRHWVAAADEAAAQDLLARARAITGRALEPTWQGLLTLNLAERAIELIERWQTTQAVAAQVLEPERPITPALRALIGERGGRPLHLDYGLALLSALATVVAVLSCCAFWIFSAWPEGAVAASLSAVICCFFATLDDPVPAQRGFLAWTALSVPICAVYLFAILPGVHDFVTLVLVLAPTLLAAGAAMALPHWFSRMTPLIIGIAGGLALTNEFSPDTAGFFNASVAQLVGCAAAIFSTRLFRSLGAGAAIRRLRRAGWRDLAALARQAPRGPADWASRMLDRVGLLAGRVGDVEGGEDRDAAAASLRELRIGVNVAQLENDAAELREAIGAYFARRARGSDAPPPPDLLHRLDEAIRIGWRLPDAAAQRRTLNALTGLRRNFFPAAPAWAEAAA